MTGARWCVLYVDTPDLAAVLDLVTGLLGPADDLDVVRVPGFTVDVRRNPDRTGGRHYLDWPSTVDIDAAADVPDSAVVNLVTTLIDRLHDAGLRVGTESTVPHHHLRPPDHRPDPAA
jgi:hypothetical protein